MSNELVWEPGEAVRVRFGWEDWAEGEPLTGATVTAHPDFGVSELTRNDFEVTALISIPEGQQIGSQRWIRFGAQAGTRRAFRTQRVRVDYRSPLLAD